ncbi:adenylate/guanylate cyclase domain-containing protein [uncultured Psychroserpens sp.]|uniref:adenylate/guanylate cyclase domain-containing protein n=1 Tax=uncultured Psychroserpens sp. TaxID=255436 RepID=UPI002618A37F|nr:adenylate/guanylate cyclase domain-containing protein [uncultured Psychroserpens sp.]
MSQQRLLAAIMFTDIEDYTALMQRDEKEALNIRDRHRSTFEMTTDAFHGKIIQYFGDGTLSIFTSSVEAVKCAIELQKAFLEDPKIPVRIGIHVGDIIYSDEDIIGDAVNVASRVESCAVAGSVLISDKVHDQIRSHQDIDAQFLDAYELKNVDGAMPIFAISNDNLVVPKPEDVKGKLKGSSATNSSSNSKTKWLIIAMLLIALTIAGVFAFQHFNTAHGNSKALSIAVLPFENLSAESDAEIFRDGITEDILTQLSKIKDLHVISRTSVMQYKNTKKTIPEIAKELGVSYILEGSIRKYGNDIRIVAQLIDAVSDEHLWAENYDKTLTNIFSLQTEVSKEIVDALEINLSFEEAQGLAVIPTQNIDAYKLFLEGRNEADKRNTESLAKSILLYKEAIALDPNYALAYAEIANSIYLETYYSRRDPVEASNLAKDYLDKAEKINDKISRIYSVKGLINNIEGNHDAAEIAFKRAIKLSPNDLTARHQYSTYFFYTGQYKKQLEQAEIAYRLDPLSFPTANSYFNALLANEEYERAETIMDKIQNRDDDSNQFVINRSYFRLFMDQKKFKKAIPYLEEIVKVENVFNRFLGYCYVKTGDTLKAYRTIDSIRKNAHPGEKSHQLAVVYSALKNNDSVFFHLDTIRNKQTRTLKREYDEFFDHLQTNKEFQNILKSHGIDMN